MESWSPSTIFSLVATQPNISPESTWSLPGVQLPSRWTHLDWMDSTSEHRELLINPARLIITSLSLLLYNTKKGVTSMNWTHDFRSTATLSSMNPQPLGPQRLIYVDIFYAVYTNWVIAFLERMSANSDAQFGIINQQHPLAFNHHPQHLAPPPLHHYHPQQPLLPLTAYNHSTQPTMEWPMAMWQCHIMSHNNHQHNQRQRRMPENEHKWWPALTNGHKRWWAKVRQLTSPPFNILIWNPGAMLLPAMWQPNDEWQPRFIIHCCC